MAFITDTRGVAATASFFSRAKAALSSSFWAAMNARSRVDQIEQFERMTDRQLADIGLERENIVAHVFRDKFHI